MNAGLRTRTSLTEQRLRALLEERIRVPRGVNTVRVNRMFYGKQEVWPDILVPALRIAIEYDDPGRSRRAHLRPEGGLRSREGRRPRRGRLGGHPRARRQAWSRSARTASSARRCTADVADRIVARMAELRGDDAVDALRVGASGAGSSA